MQLGANDGKRFDLLHPFIVANKKYVTGILLEPVHEYFTELQNTYKGYSKLKLLPLAIHSTESTTTIYRHKSLNKTKTPEWTKGIASFNPEHHIQSGVANSDIVGEIVNCISLRELIARENILHLDLLMIDTEGYDAEIICQIPFDKVKPSLIRFETGINFEIITLDRFNQVRNILHAEGYELIIEEEDTIAYLF
jgi:FkbM family methyltransferase